MLKRFFILIVFFVCSFAYAVPNTWMSDTNMGITEFNLVNTKNQAISFSCWSGQEVHEPSFAYMGDWSDESGLGDFWVADMADTHKLSLRIDGNPYFPHPLHWSEFIAAISKGKKIEVFSNNMLLAIFTPTKNSINKTAKYIKNDCSYDLWH